MASASSMPRTWCRVRRRCEGWALALRPAIGMPTVDGHRARRCCPGWLWPGAASSQPDRPAIPAPCPPLADREGFILDAPPLADAICHDPLLKPLKLIAAPSDESLLPRSGVRGFPHWGLWQQRNAGFGRDLMAFLAEGGCWASLVFGGQYVKPALGLVWQYDGSAHTASAFVAASPRPPAP